MPTDKSLNISLEWNAASINDWSKIKRLFVAAYVSSYKDCPLNTLDLSSRLVEEANDKRVDPLAFYFAHEFEAERDKILEQHNTDKFKINYLIVRFHEQPIAFIVSQLNYKSGRVYIRWNTVSPAFHRNGIGKMMLDEVARFYENTGLELYTRHANVLACNFYKKNGLIPITKFNFKEPSESDSKVTEPIGKFASGWLQELDYKDTIFPPLDEKINEPVAYIGFCKSKLKY